MINNYRSRLLLTAIILIILTFNLHSQVVVERSKEKVIISGVPYYIHLVKKGETAYSISRAYGITVDELTKENPPALYGVRRGRHSEYLLEKFRKLINRLYLRIARYAMTANTFITNLILGKLSILCQNCMEFLKMK